MKNAMQLKQLLKRKKYFSSACYAEFYVRKTIGKGISFKIPIVKYYKVVELWNI